MMLSEKLRSFRENINLPQRKITVALDIETATYFKSLFPKRKQIDKLSSLLNEDKDELIKLWFADKICDVVNGKSLV